MFINSISTETVINLFALIYSVIDSLASKVQSIAQGFFERKEVSDPEAAPISGRVQKPSIPPIAASRKVEDTQNPISPEKQHPSGADILNRHLENTDPKNRKTQTVSQAMEKSLQGKSTYLKANPEIAKKTADVLIE
ncbi:MAG: hypothetical protein KDK63_02290, partial [Chlamydiia bacterium]|nr:hypothetical protein [Chlamydiia bacterium]